MSGCDRCWRSGLGRWVDRLLAWLKRFPFQDALAIVKIVPLVVTVITIRTPVITIRTPMLVDRRTAL